MEWGKEFVQTFGGYIDNLNDTIACRYCQFSVGDQFFTPLNIQFSHRWRDAFILFSFFGEYFFRFLSQTNQSASSLQPCNHNK